MNHILAILLIAVTHYIGGIATFGSSFLAVPLLILLYGPEQLERVVIVMMAVGVLQAYLIAWRTWQDKVPSVLVAMLVGAGVGLPLGIYGLRHLSTSIIMPLIGALILIAGIANLKQPSCPDSKHKPILTGVVAILAGAVHGATASGGTVLVAYTQRVLWDKSAFRATLAAFWSCVNTIFLVAAFALGSIGSTELGLSVAAAAVVLPVTWLADRTARRVDTQRFHLFVCVLLVFSGAALLIREAFR